MDNHHVQIYSLNLNGNGRHDQISGEAAFEAAFGERLDRTLDIDSWMTEDNLAATYARIDEEVAAAALDEERYRQHIRQEILSPEFFANLQRQHNLPIAGRYQASVSDIQQVHGGLLFGGGVEACDGTSIAHDTLLLTIIQVGVSLVSYAGTRGSFGQRLFRRDLRATGDNAIDELVTLLKNRECREGQGMGGNQLSELARRGIMTYAERKILAHKATARWRLGHGSPIPYEILTNFWTSPKRIQLSVDLIRWYVHEHQRFVFVPSAPRDRHLLTIGNALNAREYLILGTLRPDVSQLIANSRYRGKALRAMTELRDEIAPQVVVGLYRAWQGSPAYLFYAHRDHADLAAHIVIADSLLQPHRGFPMLIDLADALCTASFGGDTFFSTVQTAYAQTGQTFRYFGERETRYE